MTRLEITGVDELVADMRAMIEQYPEEASNALFEIAESFNEDVNAKYPGNYKTSGKESLTRWKVEGAKEGNSHFVTSRNKAPHFHLVENGHDKYDFHGHYTGGWVPGKHYAERTREEYESKYPEMIEKSINQQLDKHNL